MTAKREQELMPLVVEIEALDRAACLNHWREAFERSPPKHLSLTFMHRVLIWQLQNERLNP